MTDRVGTIRRETHGGPIDDDTDLGWSLWVLVKTKTGDGYNQEIVVRPVWLCAESTAVGNIGEMMEVHGLIEGLPLWDGGE